MYNRDPIPTMGVWGLYSNHDSKSVSNPSQVLKYRLGYKLLAVVAPEAHDDPLSPSFEVQKKQAATGLNNNVRHIFITQGYKTMGKGGKYSRYVSYHKHSVPKWKSLELEMSIAVPYMR